MSETSHLLENIVIFCRMLRQAGLSVSSEQTIDFARALELIELSSREQVYHAARAMLLDRHENSALFETIFNRFWRGPDQQPKSAGQKGPLAPRHRPKKRRPFTLATYMAEKARPADPEMEIVDRTGSFSNTERLQGKDFATMTEAELVAIKRLMQDMRWQVSLRRTRRQVPDPTGRRLHLRRVLRSAAKYGGIPLRLTRQSNKIKQRPLVLLADISGSMEKYARLMLQFFYSISHSLKAVECFVFGTRMTRITGQLKLKNIDRAVEEAAAEVVDWSGGTRIGASLQAFNQQWSRRVLRRGAIVLIISDGWERGEVALLKQEMRYLQHRCHRLIWLNPLLGKTTYQPLVEGMAAALPFVDDFLPIHNLQSLAALTEHLAALGRYQSARPQFVAL